MSGKAVARAGKSIDWDHLSKVVVSDAGKRELASLRRAYDDVAATLNEKFNVKPTSINWDFYKQKLGPSVVNIFQQSYESLDKQVPDYQDDLTPVYEAKHQELLKKALVEEEDSKRKIVLLEKEIENVREEKAALKTMTVDEYFAKNPEVKEKIDDEIRNHNWGYKFNKVLLLWLMEKEHMSLHLALVAVVLAFASSPEPRPLCLGLPCK
ncbi:unnamed protein product [Sphagnum troendelagicum]|uniref:ATP synthase subunit d, mitochondrial n=1 Tax=Sphagnum troendelagicum TaxID=128251 RepID=A0ABP0U4D1_9BRYO